jgi:2-iminobutanoate/2-iminopropanoate deaminase
MTLITSVQPPGMATPQGHYSPGIIAGGFVFVSGQLPMDPATGQVVPGGIEAQTERALRNVELVLVAAGASLDRVLQMTIYISDGDKWGAVNATYAKVMGAHRPARAVVPVSPLHYGALIEIQAIAAAPR